MKYLFLSLPLLAFILPNQQSKPSKNPLEAYAFVPSGNVWLDGKEYSVQSFYISKGEVTNKQYKTFLAELKAANQLEKYKIALPDTTKWVSGNFNYPEFKNLYFNNPGFDNYPVVNISYEAAKLYCEWLTEKMNALPGNKDKFSFRLPLKGEYLRACRGEAKNQVYMWPGNGLRDDKGRILCNFLRFDAENIHYNFDTKQYEIVKEKRGEKPENEIQWMNSALLAPSIAYWPNAFGLYNLNGNAAEMLESKGFTIGGGWRSTGYDVRNESTESYEIASPTIGFRPVSTYLKL